MSTTISHDSSQAVLKILFSEADRERMGVLAEKARQGTLDVDEQAEIDGYDRIGTLLSLLKSKARTSLGNADLLPS